MFIIAAFVTVYVGDSVGEKKRGPEKAIASGKEIRPPLGDRVSHRKNYAVQLNVKISPDVVIGNSAGGKGHIGSACLDLMISSPEPCPVPNLLNLHDSSMTTF